MLTLQNFCWFGTCESVNKRKTLNVRWQLGEETAIFEQKKYTLESCPRGQSVVVAQLAEWSLPNPAVCRSNPVFGEISQRMHLLITTEKKK